MGEVLVEQTQARGKRGNPRSPGARVPRAADPAGKLMCYTIRQPIVNHLQELEDGSTIS